MASPRCSHRKESRFCSSQKSFPMKNLSRNGLGKRIGQTGSYPACVVVVKTPIGANTRPCLSVAVIARSTSMSKEEPQWNPQTCL